MAAHVAFLTYEEGEEIDWGVYQVREVVKTGCKCIAKENIKPWFDEYEKNGHTLAARQLAIEQSSVVVPFITKRYIKSNVCRDDLQYAYGLHKPIAPVYLENVNHGLLPKGVVYQVLTCCERSFDFSSFAFVKDNWHYEKQFIELIAVLKDYTVTGHSQRSSWAISSGRSQLSLSADTVTPSVRDARSEAVENKTELQQELLEQHSLMKSTAELGVDKGQEIKRPGEAADAGFYDFDLYKNFQLEARVSPGVGYIDDLLLYDNKLVALVREKNGYKSNLVELDDAGHEVRVICSEKLKDTRRATSSGGKIVVASDEGLLSVTSEGRVETIAGGVYTGCCTADEGSVYAVRRKEVVFIDITTNEEVTSTVQTHIKSSGSLTYTVVPGSAPHVALVGSSVDHCVYEVSLSDGSTLNTYGHKGRGGAGELKQPSLCFKLNHEVVVADDNNHRLQILNTMKTESWSILNTSAELSRPQAAVNKQGKLYVASVGSNPVLYILK